MFEVTIEFTNGEKETFACKNVVLNERNFSMRFKDGVYCAYLWEYIFDYDIKRIDEQ